ncbi:uncharacterized protein LOC141972831 [Athene noctua]|uniref:uncharacterized protein LOC141972831 n=1 Tax=Athene noctua TaxID=126797 RepID=UPI003EC12809
MSSSFPSEDVGGCSRSQVPGGCPGFAAPSPPDKEPPQFQEITGQKKRRIKSLVRQSSADGDSGSQRGSASDAEERREREEDCEGRAEPGATLRADKTLEKAGSSAAPAKQARPKNSFLTGPHPASVRGSAYECPQTKIRKRPLLAPPSPPLGHSVRQRWAPRGICRRRAAAPPGAPDGERAAPPPLPREQLNGGRVPAARAASAPLRRDAPPARRRVRGSLNTPEKYYIIVNK